MDYSRLGNMRKRRRQNSQTTRLRNKISLLFLRATLAAALVGMFAFAAMGLGAWLGVLAYAPELMPHGVMHGSYASVVVCPRTGEELARLHAGVNRTHVSIEDIPEHVINAFIAIEDERFFYHNGIDVRGIGRAVWRLVNPAYSTSEGASTITQQLIKNRLERFDSDLTTKLQEQYLAVRWESELTELLGCNREAKYYILQEYLNTINLGRTNHGVQAAALFYYGVDVWDLTIAQAATIAAITQNPNRFPPDRHPEANWARAQLVLGNMLRLEFITEEEFYEAMNSNVFDTIVRDEAGEIRATVSPFDCFTDALVSQLVEDLVDQFGISEFTAYEWLFTRGLRIYSTQNTCMQAIVDDVMMDDEMFPVGPGRFEIDVTYHLTTRNALTGQPNNRTRTRTVNTMEQAIAAIYEMQYDMMGTHDVIVSEHRIFTPQPQAGFVLMDHHNGHVLAVRGVRGEKVMSRTHCRATIATRSPGSQLKPLVFAAGFDIGVLSPATPIEDSPWAIHPQGGQRYRPANWWWHTTGYRGLMSSRTAIYSSANVVSVKALVDYVGIETAFAYMQNLGLSTLEGVTAAGRAWSDRIPALALGGLTQGVILLDLAGAYATIANEGMYNRPIFYTHVLNQDGSLLIENNHAPRQVLRRETAYLVTNSMIDTMSGRGTGPGQLFRDAQLRRDIPISGKTGTSQLGRDSGFVGFSPYFTGAVWLGFDMPRPLPANYTRYREGIWRTIMERVHYGMAPRSFERPSGIIVASVCRDSGHPATEFCRTDPRGNRTISDVFASGSVPPQPCPVHQQLRICDISGLLAGDSCHPIFIHYRVGMVLPPLPEWALGTPVRGRQYAFSNDVLEGRVCVNCQYHHHEWFQPSDPYSPYNDYNHGNAHPGYGYDWPWNIPQPTPPPYEHYNPQPPEYNQPPPYSYYPIPTPPPYDDAEEYTPVYTQHSGYDS